VHSDDHWSFVTPLRPGEAHDPAGLNTSKTISYQGRTYKIFQEATAKVTYVVGEFYWRVEVGETVDTVDYIAPPFGISKELTTSGAREVSYSHARYMPPEEVEQAFNVRDLTRPTTVGPMQPFPGSSLGRMWVAMLLLLVVTAIVLAIRLPGRTVLQQTIDASAVPPSTGMPENARMIFSEPFTLTGDHNVEIRGDAPVDNSWLYIEGDLVDESSGRFESFELPLEYYHGYDGGESWSEGKRARRVFLAHPPPGRYTLALGMQWQAARTPASLNVTVREGVFRWPYFILALLAISVLPVLAAIRKISWESQRWKDSSYTPFGQWQSGDEGDDDEE
jgi:hypothetical protein